MKNKIFLSLSLLLFFISASWGQQEYKVGSATVSIEPDSTIFSIALSGYGYPAEGRFSIDWIARGDAPGDITAIAGLDGKFYAVDGNNTLWTGTSSGEAISWKKAGTADGIKALAGMNGSLYAANDLGEILACMPAGGKIRWKKLGGGTFINSLTASGGNLYATNNKNTLIRMNPLQQDKGWINIRPVNNIRCMASYGARLFAIDSGDTLWRLQANRAKLPQTEIGRHNGITFNIHIKQIAVLDGRFYAVSTDNKIYIARHSSDGDLSATALAIQRNKKTVVMVGVDLTGFSASLSNEVKDIVFKERGVPRSAILINASHSHFAPSAQAYLAWQDFMEYPDSLYLNNILKKGLVKAIENAVDAMAPADLYMGRGTTNIGLNRTSGDTENPLDKTLDVLAAKNSQGKITGIMFLAACHAVFNSEGRETYTISANFPGTTRDIIREKFGVNSIFIQGCGGDINPRSLDHKETGKELAGDIFNVLNEKLTKITGDISYSLHTINIPIQHTLPAALDSNGVLLDSMHIMPWRVDTLKKFQADNLPHFEDLYARRNAKWAGMMVDMIKKGTLPAVFPEYIQLIDIGNWKLVGLSREAVNEYGPAVRKIWPDNVVSVAGYCNDVGSYLPNKWHVARHLYEGYGSFYWYGQPGIPPLDVFEIVVDGIKSLKR